MNLLFSIIARTTCYLSGAVLVISGLLAILHFTVGLILFEWWIETYFQPIVLALVVGVILTIIIYPFADVDRRGKAQ